MNLGWWLGNCSYDKMNHSVEITEPEHDENYNYLQFLDTDLMKVFIDHNDLLFSINFDWN